jgi:hypothetical protein
MLALQRTCAPVGAPLSPSSLRLHFTRAEFLSFSWRNDSEAHERSLDKTSDRFSHVTQVRCPGSAFTQRVKPCCAVI